MMQPDIAKPTPDHAATGPNQWTARSRWARFCLPTLADAVFLLVLLRVLQLGATALFNDPGTGWHLRTGHEILATGAVPVADLYSTTRVHEPWVETQWLGDVVLSATYLLGGYELVALATALIIAGLFRWVYRSQIAAGGWPAIAALTTLAAACAASIHFLARPLLATFVGVPLCFWWATQYARGRIGPSRLWLLLPIAVVWCNVHPGVLGGMVTVGICGVGLLLGLLRQRQTADRTARLHRGLTLVFIAAGMGAATLVNPYGIHWHTWIAKLMGFQVLARYVSEWKPLAWTDAAAIVGLLLAATWLVSSIVRRKKTNLPEVLATLFWISQAVQSARHVPLTAIILALQLGRLLADVRVTAPRLAQVGARVPLFSDGIRQAEARATGGLVSTTGAGVLLLLVIAGVHLPAIGLGTAGPPEEKYSRGVVAYLRTHQQTGPFFNDLNYGGTLIRDVPGLRVFIDDRFGLYGEEFVEHYCGAALKPKANAARLLDRWQIETALVGTKLPICRWLADNPEWSETYRDAAAVVYTRKPNPRS